MALQVQGSFELQNGIQLTQLYARTNAALSVDGKSVWAQPEFWVDNAAFSTGKDSIDLRMNIMFNYEYDRAVEGADILVFANNKVKETLEEAGYTVTIVEL